MSVAESSQGNFTSLIHFVRQMFCDTPKIHQFQQTGTTVNVNMALNKDFHVKVDSQISTASVGYRRLPSTFYSEVIVTISWYNFQSKVLCVAINSTIPTSYLLQL